MKIEYYAFRDILYLAKPNVLISPHQLINIYKSQNYKIILVNQKKNYSKIKGYSKSQLSQCSPYTGAT